MTTWELRVPGHTYMGNMPFVPEAFLAPSNSTLISVAQLPWSPLGMPSGDYTTFLLLIESELLGIAWYVEGRPIRLEGGRVHFLEES